ncbi:hypothetical protein QQ045_008755 [Rhodiola kirilowii]
MLDSALYYRQALRYFALFDIDFKTFPTSEEWNRIEVISKFLGEFYEVTSLFSGTKYATSNLFFPKVVKIQHSIQEVVMHEVMDPRFKMVFVEWAYIKLYGEDSCELMKLKEALHSLYEAMWIDGLVKLTQEIN